MGARASSGGTLTNFAPPAPAPVPDAPAASTAVGATAAGPYLLAAVASIGAGAVHAAAVGIHAEHRQAAVAFAGLAFLQIAWGALAVTGHRRLVGVAGVVVSLVAVGGWVLAKTVGIGFIDGIGEVEPIQFPDLAAMLLAAVAVVAAARALVVRADARPARTVRSLAYAPSAVLAGFALFGMATISGHDHAGTGHSQGSAAAAGQDHGAGHTSGPSATDGTSAVDDDATPVVLAAKPYDPKKPIDLSGAEGVSLEQQARAENLIAITLIRLPHFADYRVAEAEGYRSIRDGVTGHEHFIKWDAIDDDRMLDPDEPESLVYDTTGGGRKLVSAMFMMPPGKTLDDVPDIGGPLTQWHIHDNLCFGGPKGAEFVAGITNAKGECPSSLRKFTPVPMIHVWITKHPCGPFASLEGVGAGQIKEGETRLCDQAHGGH